MIRSIERRTSHELLSPEIGSSVYKPSNTTFSLLDLPFPRILLALTMSQLIVLPTPLVPDSLQLGQLITDPINAISPSFTPSVQSACEELKPEPNYQVTVVHDDYGRFLRTASDDSHMSQDRLLLLTAEVSATSFLSSPQSAIDSLRQDSAALTFTRKATMERQNLYYVTGIQKLKCPSFQRLSVAEAATGPIRLLTHVRRHESATTFGRADSTQQIDDEHIFAVELLKIKCRIGDASEPHSIDDIGYQWSYHLLEDGSQLSLGVGGALKSNDMRKFAGIVADEDYTDDSWDSYNSEDDDGIGGF